MRRHAVVFVMLGVALAAACEHSVTTVRPRGAVPVAPRASLANGLPLGLTGNTGVGRYIICSVGADATYSWSSTAWGPTKIGGYSDTAKSGTAAVANGGADAPAAWGSGKCVTVYAYPTIDQHQFMKPLVTSSWQAQAGIQLDSIVQDSVTAQDLTVFPGPSETISSHPGASSLTGVSNNDYGQIVFYYFHAMPPSLNLVKTADAPAVSAGDPIGFTLTLTSGGPGAADDVTLSDPLPSGAGLSWSLSPAVGGCGIAGGVLSCSFASLAAGTSVSVHLVSPTTTQSCGPVPNTASAQGTGVAPVQATASITVQCPNLTLSKVSDAASVPAGNPIGFSMVVSNVGPGTAHGVTLTDPLPAGAGLAWSVSPANAACSIAAGTLTCTFGDLAAGGSASVHVTSPTTTQSCGSYDNTATAQGNGTGAIQATASTAVTCPTPCAASSIVSNFNGTPIAAGNWIWFNAIVKVTGLGASGGTVHALGSSIVFSANGTSYNLPVPDATITFSTSATEATTAFNALTGWQITVPAGYSGNVFLGGTAFQLPVGFPGGINPVTWSTQLSSGAAGVTYQWKWAAAVYTSFAANSDAIGAKPIDGGTMNPYPNSDHAGTPESFKAYVIGGARGGGGSNFTGSYSGTASSGVCTR